MGLEQPTDIQTKPLNMKKRDDRLRAVVGLTSDDPVAGVTIDTLWAYGNYLAEQLSFPFEARGNVGPRRFFNKRRTVTVVGLGSPGELGRLDENYVLICEVKIDGNKGDAPLADPEVDQ